MSKKPKICDFPAAQFPPDSSAKDEDQAESMDVDSENPRIPVPLSEYKEAEERFNKSTLKRHGNELLDNADADKCALDDIMDKICNGNTSIELGNNSTLFYDLIFHSDYVQIKSKVIEILYSELCKKFIFSNLIDDVINNLYKLESIPHVKKYIVQGIFKELQITPLFENTASLILRYSEKKSWHDLDINNINSITIRPCAFKVMFSNGQFDLIHINFLLNLLRIKNLILNGCNLNGRNTIKLFSGLELTTLGLSECGTSVNQIIQDHSSKEFMNLKNLDVSNNPLFNATLEKISCIPLKSLNISECIKTSGTFVNSIWFSKTFKCEGSNERGKIELLWSEGILSETIEVLNISYNHISEEILQQILQLNLKELDITKCLKYVQFSRAFVNSSIKILKSRRNKINYEKLKSFCGLPLERLEIDYYGSVDEDFSDVSYSALSCHLNELSVKICTPCEHFISFISKLRLKYFECEMKPDDSDSCPIASFLSNTIGGGNHLETLIIGGVGWSISNELIAGIKKFNLKELSISSPYQKGETLCKLLSSENLQESVVTLKLSEHDMENDDLVQITKFKKLEKLKFCYSSNISEELLKTVVEMNTLKELELGAAVGGELNLKLARLLCIAPVKSLSIFDDYGQSISKEAFEYLSKYENLLQFSKNLVNLNMRATIKPNMAKVLSKGNWESIHLDTCLVQDNAMKLMFDNDNLAYTLDIITYSDGDIHWEDIVPLRLSTLMEKVQPYQFVDEIRPMILDQEPLGKFLRYLFLENTIEIAPLLKMNVSEVDTY